MKITDVFPVGNDPRTGAESKMLIDSNTAIGLELEVEDMLLYNKSDLFDSGLWTIVEDGSLRDNGIEFIMGVASLQQKDISPLKGVDIDRALNLLEQSLEETEAIPNLSERTSMHVHVDIRDLTVDQLINYILLFSIFEETFFKYSDYSRYTNNYCKPIGCAHLAREGISRMIA